MMAAIAPRLAIGASIYFDTELATHVAPLAKLIEQIFGVASEDGFVTQWMHRIPNKSTGSKPFNLDRMVRKITSREIAAVGVGSRPRTRDDDELHLYADTTPIALIGESALSRGWRYELVAAFGPTSLARLGPRRVIDLLVAFADTVAATAGVVHWAETTSFASCLASCSSNSRLTPLQERRISDLNVFAWGWGRHARSPSWGTFLGAAHVERLGGIEYIEQAVTCSRVVRLAAGGAFLQLTPVDDPIVEDRDDDGRIAALRTFLEPVLEKPRA